MKWADIKKKTKQLDQEQGAIVKNWGGKLTIALVYPNTYQVGMSSLGFQTLYKLFNANRHIVCERVFWQPNFAEREPVLSVETQRHLADFDLLAFSIPYEMDYPHVLQMFKQAGLPALATQREDWPPVIAGGPAISANPLPLCDFFDAFVIGEAEPIFDKLVQTLHAYTTGPRNALWKTLAQIPGVFVPHLGPNWGPIQRQWIRTLDDWSCQTVIHTPNTAFSNMHLIEISRGCARGCRFCLAGFTNRPKRERSIAKILEQARFGLEHVDRVGLVGAAVSDYTEIDTLVVALRDMGAKISVSSLRVDPLSEPLLQALTESKSKTLTLAPEAGSERLRQMINKGVQEHDLLYAAERAAFYGFKNLKLYYMIGLPTETEQDIDAIAELCLKVKARFPGRVTANITPFVPKAHTPFQWISTFPIKQLEEHLRRLKKTLRKQHIDMRGESPKWAVIQGVLARGDRQLGQVLQALEGTSRRDWQTAFDTSGIDPQTYQTWDVNQDLPWQFIEIGVKTETLRRGYTKAKSQNAQ